MKKLLIALVATVLSTSVVAQPTNIVKITTEKNLSAKDKKALKEYYAAVEAEGEASYYPVFTTKGILWLNGAAIDDKSLKVLNKSKPNTCLEIKGIDYPITAKTVSCPKTLKNLKQ